MDRAERFFMFRQAISKWGLWSQFWMATEECAELIQAINKLHRDPWKSEKSINAVCEEVADVEIMLEQLRFGLGENADNEIDRIKELKLARLKERIEDNTSPQPEEKP